MNQTYANYIFDHYCLIKFRKHKPESRYIAAWLYLCCTNSNIKYECWLQKWDVSYFNWDIKISRIKHLEIQISNAPWLRPLWWDVDSNFKDSNIQIFEYSNIKSECWLQKYKNIQYEGTLTEASPSGGMLMSVVRPGAGSVQKSSALDFDDVCSSVTGLQIWHTYMWSKI